MHHSPLQPPLTLTTNKDPTVCVAHVVMPSLPLFSFLTLSIYPVKVHEWAPSPSPSFAGSPLSPACLQAVGEGEELNFLAQSSAPALPDAAQLGIWATTTFVVGDQVGWHGAPVEGARESGQVAKSGREWEASLHSVGENFDFKVATDRGHRTWEGDALESHESSSLVAR